MLRLSIAASVPNSSIIEVASGLLTSRPDPLRATESRASPFAKLLHRPCEIARRACVRPPCRFPLFRDPGAVRERTLRRPGSRGRTLTPQYDGDVDWESSGYRLVLDWVAAAGQHLDGRLPGRLGTSLRVVAGRAALGNPGGWRRSVIEGAPRPVRVGPSSSLLDEQPAGDPPPADGSTVARPRMHPQRGTRY